MLLDDEAVADYAFKNRKQDGSGLVLAASLIDKLPNLGGMRAYETCLESVSCGSEIFADKNSC